MMDCRNLEKHFGSAEKIASCRIEHDLEEELISGAEEVLRVSSDYKGEYQIIGLFYGAWEFEEWLCSDLSYESWRKEHPVSRSVSP